MVGTSGQQPSFANTPLSPDYIASTANAPDQAAAPAAASPVVQKAEDVLPVGGSSQRQLSNEQILDLARKSINPEPPAEDHGDFDTWGRKVEGPSAATSSMDAPANAVGFAKQVLRSNQPSRAAAPAPARNNIPQAGDPLPVRRPDSIGQLSGAKTADQPSFLSRIFSGPDYQSSGRQTVERMQGPMQSGQERPATKLNWGDSDNAADFFRADKARQELEKSGEAFTTMKRGGTAQAHGKDAVLHKALEIIHHMISRGR